MVCCVTGHRPAGFPFERKDSVIEYLIYGKKLADAVLKLIHSGYDEFISGMADGADIDFAATVLMYKNKFDYIMLEAALPYPYIPPKKDSEYHDQKCEILAFCDRIHTVSNKYYKGCMHERNKYMVDKSDLILAVWNGNKKGGTWDTIKYALKKKKKIIYIRLDQDITFAPDQILVDYVKAIQSRLP